MIDFRILYLHFKKHEATTINKLLIHLIENSDKIFAFYSVTKTNIQKGVYPISDGKIKTNVRQLTLTDLLIKSGKFNTEQE